MHPLKLEKHISGEERRKTHDSGKVIPRLRFADIKRLAVREEDGHLVVRRGADIELVGGVGGDDAEVEEACVVVMVYVGDPSPR